MNQVNSHNDIVMNIINNIIIIIRNIGANLTSPKIVLSADVMMCLISDKQISGAVCPASNTLVLINTTTDT